MCHLFFFLFQEKLNTKVVTAWHNEGLLSSEAEAAIKQAQHEYQDFLRIPRRLFTLLFCKIFPLNCPKN